MELEIPRKSKHNNTLQVTFGPLPTFAVAKAGIASKDLNMGVRPTWIFMSQIERINFYNTWPNGQRFIAEQQFEEHLKSVGGKFFTPIALNNNLSATGHISLSYTLDSLDSLPMRPDHAFDWIWKAFEHLTKAAAPNLNITDSLRSFATPTICTILKRLSASTN